MQKKCKFRADRDTGFVGKLLYRIGCSKFPFLRKQFVRLCWHLLGPHYQFYSLTLRRVLKDRYGVTVGMFSHGGCCIPGRFPAGTSFGRYCSIAMSASSRNGNHPTNTRSSHAFFFNPSLGYINEETIPRTNLKVGNDVWIGDDSIILSSCEEIGDGAVVGAAAIVSKNVPPYATMIGNPARAVRYRFEKEKIAELQAEAWWEKDMDELSQNMEAFTKPLEGDEIR